MTITVCRMRRHYNVRFSYASLNIQAFITSSALISVRNHFIAGETKVRLEIFIAALINIVGCRANGFAGFFFLILTIFVTGKYGQVIK